MFSSPSRATATARRLKVRPTGQPRSLAGWNSSCPHVFHATIVCARDVFRWAQPIFASKMADVFHPSTNLDRTLLPLIIMCGSRSHTRTLFASKHDMLETNRKDLFFYMRRSIRAAKQHQQCSQSIHQRLEFSGFIQRIYDHSLLSALAKAVFLCPLIENVGFSSLHTRYFYPQSARSSRQSHTSPVDEGVVLLYSVFKSKKRWKKREGVFFLVFPIEIAPLKGPSEKKGKNLFFSND